MHFKWITAAVLFSAAPVFAAIPFHCGERISLQEVIDFAFPNETILLTGTCSGPIVISRKNTTLESRTAVSGNTLGIQIGASASAFIADPATSLTASNNFTTGLNVVSGAHLVDFGGTITASGNGVHGVSVDSKAGLDLDAAIARCKERFAQVIHLAANFSSPSFSPTYLQKLPPPEHPLRQTRGQEDINV